MKVRDLQAAAAYVSLLQDLIDLRARLTDVYRPRWSVGPILLDEHSIAAMLPALQADIDGRIAELRHQLEQRGITFDD